MFTMLPPPVSSMWGVASWLRLNAVVTFHRSAASKSLSVVSRNGPGIDPPTLLTTVVMRPWSSTARSTSAANPVRSRRLPTTTVARLPNPSMADATVWRASASRAPMTTSAPASASAIAVAAPIPRLAPVTIATWPSIRNMSSTMATPWRIVDPCATHGSARPAPGGDVFLGTRADRHLSGSFELRFRPHGPKPAWRLNARPEDGDA